MCRGADLGICCAEGCDEKIRCQDTGGYCNGHDPYDCGWLDDDDAPDVPPPPAIVDDPEKRRIYTLHCVTRGIQRAVASIRASQLSIGELQARERELLK